MNTTKYKIGMLVIYCAAFFWGYKKDELNAMIFVADRASDTSSAVPDSAAAGAAERQPESDEKPQVQSPQRLPVPAGAASPTLPAAPPRAQPPAYTPPANPYEGLSKQLQGQGPNQSFEEAFGSIKRDSISQKELLQKNSYFRRLSEDLEKLQGGPTPEPSPEAEAEEVPIDPLAPGASPGVAPNMPEAAVAEQPLSEAELPELAEEVAGTESLPPPPAPDQLIDEIDELIYELE